MHGPEPATANPGTRGQNPKAANFVTMISVTDPYRTGGRWQSLRRPARLEEVLRRLLGRDLRLIHQSDNVEHDPVQFEILRRVNRGNTH